jgi:nitrous oxide reductase accessory protein NosL
MAIIHKSWILLLFLVSGCLQGGQKVGPVEVHPDDRDPIDGMYVAKYPDWGAQIVLKNGSAAKFMCPKHLFEYYHNVNYFLGKEHVDYLKQEDVAAMFVTDYLTKRWIDARSAYYVVDSSVKSPMGDDLIPFQRLEDADSFRVSHGGRVVTFNEVDKELLRKLESAPMMMHMPMK